MKCLLCKKEIAKNDDHYKVHYRDDELESDPRVEFILVKLQNQIPIKQIDEQMREKFGMKATKDNFEFLSAAVDYYDNYYVFKKDLEKNLQQCLKSSRRAPASPKVEKKPVAKKTIAKKTAEKKSAEKKSAPKKLATELTLEEKEPADLLEMLFEMDQKSVEPTKPKTPKSKPIPIIKQTKTQLLKKKIPFPENSPAPIKPPSKPPAKIAQSPKLPRNVAPESLIIPKKKRAEIKIIGDQGSKPRIIERQAPAQAIKPGPPKLKRFELPAVKPGPAKLKKIELEIKENSAYEPSQTILSFVQMKNPNKNVEKSKVNLVIKTQKPTSSPPPLSLTNDRSKIEGVLFNEFDKLRMGSDNLFFFKQFVNANNKTLEKYVEIGADENIWNFLLIEMRIYITYLNMNDLLRAKYLAVGINPETMLNKEAGAIQSAAANYVKNTKSAAGISLPSEENLLKYIKDAAPKIISEYEKCVKKVEQIPSEKEISEIYNFFHEQKVEYEQFNIKYNKLNEYDPCKILLEPRILKLARLGMPDYDIAFILAVDIEIIRDELNVISAIDFVKNYPKDAALFSVEEIMRMFGISGETAYERIIFYKGL
jgi:hypothetical protein